jgi:hypothetical protein
VVRFDLRPTYQHSGLHIATAPFAGGHMVRLSSLGLVSTPKDSDCNPTQHGRLGMNQVPVQEGGFARRAEVHENHVPWLGFNDGLPKKDSTH